MAELKQSALYTNHDYSPSDICVSGENEVVKLTYNGEEYNDTPIRFFKEGVCKIEVKSKETETIIQEFNLQVIEFAKPENNNIVLTFNLQNSQEIIISQGANKIYQSSPGEGTYQLIDKSVEPGKKYQYNFKIVSVLEAQSSSVYCLANYSELHSSSQKTLPLKFNEKITNLKYNYADSVTPTLGSSYPFIRRNGNQNYRTFNIEAMIAFEADEFNKFISFDTSEEFNQLDDYDKMRIMQKEYRNAAIDFLHDGKIKLFRSLQEGNMLVRLSNISLTPNSQLDRNIWTFSAQATEVAAPTLENFIKYGFATVGPIKIGGDS